MLIAPFPGRRRYVDAEGLVTLKGRVAAEVQSADELLLTELLFTGVFQARPRARPWAPTLSLIIA